MSLTNGGDTYKLVHHAHGQGHSVVVKLIKRDLERTDNIGV